MEEKPTYETQGGEPRSSRTGTGGDTGNGGSAAPSAAPATAETSPASPAAKNGSGNTGNGRKRPNLTPGEALEIWQQATLQLRQAGVDISVATAPADKAGRPRTVVILANVVFDTGNFELVESTD